MKLQSEQKIFSIFNSNHWFYVVLVCFWILPLVVLSENRVEAERQNWEFFTNGDSITSVLISDDGYTLWVGTHGNGLEERDAITGELRKIYNHQNGLPNNMVWSLLSDGHGGLWAGTWNGLFHLKADLSFEVLNTENSGLPDNWVASLGDDAQGGLWIGTWSGGFAHMKSDKTWQVFNTDNSGLKGERVFSILSDGQGGVWAGTWKGLAHLKSDGTWEVFDSENFDDSGNIFLSSGSDINTKLSYSEYDPFDYYVYDIISDNQGGIWIGTDDKGVAHISVDGTWKTFHTGNSGLPDEWVDSLLSDGKGGIWIGTYRGGLAHLQSDGSLDIWEVFNKENSDLPDDWVTSLVGDGQGGLWAGTNGGLVHLKSDKTWEMPSRTEKKGLPDNEIRSLLPDNKGGFWVGTSSRKNGLANLNADGKWILFDTKNSVFLENSGVETLISDNQGGIWIGVYGGIVHFKSDGKWESFNKNNSGLPDKGINCTILDEKEGIWVGTYAGIAHLKSNGEWELYDVDNSDLPHNSIWSLILDGRGGIWAGTNGGLAHLHLNENKWVLFNSDNSALPNNSVTSLVGDGEGGIWIGTDGGGLAHLKADEKWEIYNTDNSNLPYNYLKSLLNDGNSGLWIGTQKGLAHLKGDGTWVVFKEDNSDIMNDWVEVLEPDGSGGIWIGSYGGGLAHLLQLGTPEQAIKPNYPEITINWFLNSSSLDYQNVKYIELQRSLSQDGVYETVLDESDKPVRFYADYSICPKPRVGGCWVTVEGHTPATKQDSDGKETKGYTLNTPTEDPEWLEGLPRYYRLSAVIEEDGKLVRVANNSEAALITPQVEEKPRVELTFDRNAIAMLPKQKVEITVFVSSLDLFKGDVALEIESGEGNTIASSVKVELEPSFVSLKSGETKPVLLTIEALSANLSTAGVAGSTIKIIPKIQLGYSGKSASLNLQVGDGTNSMIALSIAHKTKRTRVLDALTISGNVIPARSGQKVVISGNNIKESADSSNASDSNESLTLTTDENGYFQGSVTPIHAGLLTLTAQSNGITSNNAEIFILPARTTIALSSNVNQSTKKGDILRVRGIITPVRLEEMQNGTKLNDTKVNLDIRYLDPSDQNAGLHPQFVGSVEIDANGVFYRDVVVPGNGFINVKASLPETSDYLSINTQLVIPIGQPVGEGIIVASESGNGTSSDSGNSGLSDSEFQNISKILGQYVYNALRSRNIPAERIKYLGLGGDKIIADSNINANLATENFAKVSKSNLHRALTNWATSLFSTDDPYKTPLNLYLIGKVEDDNNGFRLNDSEVLTADDLAQYLDEAEEIVKTNSNDNYSEYKGFPVTIVLEGTQSGKWIKKIAGNGRIILTSSSDEAVDAGGFAGYDNLGESSFSRYFYEFINYGSDIEGSFAEANYEILKFYRHTQRPLMDADGDGVGTTNCDRYEASGKFIEYRPSGNLRPQIRTTNPDLTINRGDLENNFLWAIATDPENEMQGVFCSITDPSNKTVNIEMKLDTGNVYKTDLKQNYPNLATGCYQAVYYAKDKAGNVSLPEQKFLNVIASSGVFLEAPQMKITTKGNMVTISWLEVANAYGYRLFYAPYPTPNPSDIGEIDMGNQRAITFDGKGFAFYGAVKAYNNNGFSGLSNIEFFDLR